MGQGVEGPKSIPEGGRGLLCWDVTVVVVVSLSSQSHHRVQSDDGDSCPSHTPNLLKAHWHVASWLWGIKISTGGEKIALYLILVENLISGAAAGGSHSAEPISGTLGG